MVSNIDHKQGGYSLDAISASSLAVARVLLGEAPPELEPLTASPEATDTFWQVAMEQSKYWNNVEPTALEPREGQKPRASMLPLLMSLSAEMEDISFSIPGMTFWLLTSTPMLTFLWFAEILKAHRMDYLFRTHDMLQVPFVTPALDDRFSSQVACT